MNSVPSIVLTARVSLLALALAACQQQAQPAFERPPAPVTVATAIARDTPLYLDAVGKSVANEVVSVQPQISGRIVKIHFADGADLKQGDLLFSIDPRPVQATVQQAEANVARDQAQARQAEANAARDQAAVQQAQAALTQVRAQLAQAEANVVRDQAQLENARVQDQRYSELVRQGYVAREQSDQVRTAMETAAATLRADQAMVENGKAAIAAAEASLAQARAAVVAGQAAVENARATRPRQRGGGRERATAARVHGDPVAHRRARGPAPRRPRQRRDRQHGLAAQHPAPRSDLRRVHGDRERPRRGAAAHAGRAAPGRGPAARPGGQGHPRHAHVPRQRRAGRDRHGEAPRDRAESRAPLLARALRQRPPHPRPGRGRRAHPRHGAAGLGEGPVRLRRQGRRDRRASGR